MKGHISIGSIVVGCCVTELAELCRQAHIIQEMVSRDHENRFATGSSLGLGLKAHLNATSHGEIVMPVMPVPTVDAGSQVKKVCGKTQGSGSERLQLGKKDSHIGRRTRLLADNVIQRGVTSEYCS